MKECNKCHDAYQALSQWYKGPKEILIAFMNDHWKGECSNKAECKPFEHILFEYRANQVNYDNKGN